MKTPISITNFLEKNHLISLKCLIIAWIAYWTILGWDILVLGWRFGVNNGVYAQKDWVIALVSLVLGWKYLTRRSNSPSPLDTVQKAIDKEYRAFCTVRILMHLLSSLVFLYFCVFFTFITFQMSLRPLALVADHFQEYELAERFYKTFIPREPDQSFAALRSSFIPEDEKASYARNAAVAKVYGENSLEMAERYIYLGKRIENTTKYGDTEGAFRWFRKALPITDLHNASDKYIYTLKEMALLKYDQKQLSEVQKFIDQARSRLDGFIDLSNLSNRRTSEYYYALSFLEYFAAKLGDSKDQQLFHSRFSLFGDINPVGEKQVFPRFFGLLIIALFITIIPVGDWLINLLLFRSYKQTVGILTASKNILVKLACLNKLMNIDLYRNNFKHAQQHSINALELVGFPTEQVSNYFDEKARPKITSVFLPQLHAGLFIGIFLGYLIR